MRVQDTRLEGSEERELICSVNGQRLGRETADVLRRSRARAGNANITMIGTTRKEMK